jgi:hypothetical protein
MKALIYTLPLVVPVAAGWVARQEARILATGERLTPAQLEEAEFAGVKEPRRMRVLIVDKVPMPTHPLLVQLGTYTGLIGTGVAGMALRYGIYIRRDCEKQRGLLVHECVHTGQYERLGSIAGFLTPYLTECLDPGYPNGPMEQEAVIVASKWVKRGRS